MSDNSTVNGIFTLPSKGLVYGTTISDIVELRSMTTNEEMKRLNKNERPNIGMASIIDDCLVKPLGISAYDLCLADYQFLLHKLRTVTYGDDYEMESICPYCGSSNTDTVNLNQIVVNSYDEELYKHYKEFELPVTKKKIVLKMQTPRLMDDTTLLIRDSKKGNKSTQDLSLLYTLCSLIDTIDGEKLPSQMLYQIVRDLPMKDTNTIMAYSKALNDSFGLELGLQNVCPVCGLDYPTTFRITGEFFRPTLDI